MWTFRPKMKRWHTVRWFRPFYANKKVMNKITGIIGKSTTEVQNSRSRRWNVIVFMNPQKKPKRRSLLSHYHQRTSPFTTLTFLTGITRMLYFEVLSPFLYTVSKVIFFVQKFGILAKSGKSPNLNFCAKIQ